MTATFPVSPTFRTSPRRAAQVLSAACLALGAGLLLTATAPAWAGGAEMRMEVREFRGDRPPGDGRGRWFDGAHGHNHYYPAPGWRVGALPMHSRVVFYGGARYSFWDGVWYAPGPAGYVVVRPPYGVVVADLPAFATVVAIGGVSYWYLNGIYYRQLRDSSGYEVVSAPVAGSPAGNPLNAAPAPDKLFVYPRNGQSAEAQASDEYECHRWAVTQSGFDPTATATATATANGGSDTSKRSDYGRAQAACLDGRGYTVK